MTSKQLLTTLGASLALAGAALAQGSDSCAGAQPVAGLGLFAFDNTVATTDGAPDPLCDYFGQQDVDQDVWFTWVAPSDGIFTVETCGLTAVDTKIGIYDGSCAGAVLACNDDSCGSLQTSLSWNGTGGNTYLIRLGTYPGAVGGTGQFDLREEVPTLNPANGHRYMVVDQALAWDAASAAAQAAVYDGSPGHLVTIADQAELDWLLANLVFDRPWIGLFHDTQSPSYQEPDLGWAWVTGEPTSFFNWAAGEPNDTSGSGGAEDYCEMFASGEWNDAELNHLATVQYIIEFEGAPPGDPYCGGDVSASCPCFVVWVDGLGCPNSSGVGAGLVAAGNAQVSNDSFRLDVGGVPGVKPGLVVKGSTQTMNLVGDGILCTSPELRSQVQLTDASGAATFTDFQGMPFGATANLGSHTYYQYWYRDQANPCGGGFNFSNAWATLWQM